MWMVMTVVLQENIKIRYLKVKKHVVCIVDIEQNISLNRYLKVKKHVVCIVDIEQNISLNRYLKRCRVQVRTNKQVFEG